MSGVAWYALQLAVVATIGIAVHEACHYFVVRAHGWSARPSYGWSGLGPAPCIRVELREQTPTGFRLASLAPLVVFVPSVVAGPLVYPEIVTAMTSPSVPLEVSETAGLWWMWCLAVFPSPPDWRNAWNAADLSDYHAVWYGEHVGHAAAEGIA